MEVDGHPFSDLPAAAGAAQATAEASGINNEADSRFPKVFREECMRLSRPQRYDGRGDAQVLDEFVAGLRTYLHFYTESEEQRVLLASCFLEGEARQWWLYLCNGQERPRGIDTVASFVQALLGRFMPRSAREQALGELRKLKQGKLSIDRYIEKYQFLVQKSHNVDPELQYQWFIAGLAPGERQSVTAWAADRELKGEVVGLDTMVQFLRIKERRNATATALADKCELAAEDNPDVEPMEIGAVTARPVQRRSEERRRAPTGATVPNRPQAEAQMRTCFFCGKTGHLIKDCKRMQKAKELERREWASRRKSPEARGRGPQGNAKAPAQHAAQ